MQQAIEHTLGVALVEERRVAYLHGNGVVTEFIKPGRQLPQACGSESRWQLKPERHEARAQWRKELEESVSGGELVA
ncbi:hypothetical protein D3C81_2032250 [compost metagenome]